MRNLTEVAKIVEKIRLKPTDLIMHNSSKESKSDIFYQKILDGSFKTDRDASEFFYQSDTNNSNYKNLKRFLRQKLLSTIFFIDHKKTTQSDYGRAYLYCCKNMFAAKLLMFLHSRNSAIDLCQKVYSKSIQFELTEFTVSSSRYLRLHYGSRIGNLDRFNEYDTTFKKHLKIFEIELLAEEYFARLVLPTLHKKALREDASQIDTFRKELKGYMEVYSSPYLHLYGYYMHVASLLSVNDYKGTVEVCDEAIKFFEAKTYTYITPLRIFLHHQLICYTQLKSFEKGKIAAEKSANLIDPGTYSWFVNNELHTILALHSKRYEDAKEILYKTIGYYKFKSAQSIIQEKWYIHEAYIHFLVFIGKIETTETTKRFRLGKFLNSIPTFSKDKRGLNIPILIIQILFMIVKKDYEQAIDRFEAIEKYCSRYLRKDDNFRSNCFVKMLLQIPNANFHKVAVERKTKKYYDQLKSVPLEVANQVFEVEIIPYEDLWEFIMEFLGTKFHQSKRKR